MTVVKVWGKSWKPEEACHVQRSESLVGRIGRKQLHVLKQNRKKGALKLMKQSLNLILWAVGKPVIKNLLEMLFLPF